jgi:alpha-mannosidase
VESRLDVGDCWRVRAVTVADLPPLGWAAYEMAYRENPGPQPAQAAPAASAPLPNVIENGIYRVSATPGRTGIHVMRNGKALLSGDGLGVITVNDEMGAWGDLHEKPELIDVNDLREKWTIERVETLESGPVRASLWVRLRAGSSTLDFTIGVTAGRDAVDVNARLLLDERSARVKLVMPVAGSNEALYDVPAARVTRGDEGEVVGRRWVSVKSSEGNFGFASDSLYNFNFKPGVLQATIARATRYTASDGIDCNSEIWTPAIDRGELKFRFLLSPGDRDLEAQAQVLDQPPIVQVVPSGPGRLGRTGSLGSVEPRDVSLLALKPAEQGDGLVVRVQNLGEENRDVVLTLGEDRVPLGPAPVGKIVTWRLTRSGSGWTASVADSMA